MSVLVDDTLYRRLQRRARQSNATVSDEVRAILAEKLDEPADDDWFIKLAEIGAKFPALGPPLDHTDIDRVVGEGLAEERSEIATSFAAGNEGKTRKPAR